MDGRSFSRMLGIAGGLAGALVFIAFGFMQGVLIGGAAGLQLGGCIPGQATMSAEAASRLLTGLGMVCGVMLSATMFVSSGFAAGRLIGYVAAGGRAAGRAHDIAGTAGKSAVHF